MDGRTDRRTEGRKTEKVGTKILIIDKTIKLFLQPYVSIGLTVTFQAPWFHRVFPSRTQRTAVAFPGILEAELLSMTSLSCKKM